MNRTQVVVRLRDRGLRVVAFVGLLAALALAACGDDDDQGGNGANGAAGAASEVELVGVENEYEPVADVEAKRPYELVLVIPHTDDSFTGSVAEEVVEYGKAHGVNVTVYDAGGYANVAKQVSQIETAATRKPDAILAWTADATAVVPALRQAEEQGTKIVGFLAPPKMDTEFVVTSDYAKEGKTMADALFKKMGGSGKVMVQLGGAGSYYASELHKGFEQALKENPDIEVVADLTIPDFDPSKTQAAVENQLVRTPDLGGVMTTLVSMAVSATDAITAAGNDGKTFAVGAILSGCDDIEALKQNRLAIAVGEPAVYTARVGIANTIRMLNGEKVEPLTLIPNNVYTPETIEDAPLELEVRPEFREGC